MASIDQYAHACIGVVQCPSTYPIVYRNNSHRNIPLYRLDQDVASNSSFEGKKGDILLGGGSGASAALRITIPEAIYWLTDDTWEQNMAFDAILHAYWNPTQAFIFGDGYVKLGWNPTLVQIEVWLAEHIAAFLYRSYPEQYQPHFGSSSLVYEGEICRLPTDEERAIW
jgi:hypothetical protein